MWRLKLHVASEALRTSEHAGEGSLLYFRIHVKVNIIFIKSRNLKRIIVVLRLAYKKTLVPNMYIFFK